MSRVSCQKHKRKCRARAVSRTLVRVIILDVETHAHPRSFTHSAIINRQQD